MQVAEDGPVPFAGCFAEDPAAAESCSLVVVGLPDDSQSSCRRGAAQAPQRIRHAYDGRCFNATTELGVDLTQSIADWGNLARGSQWSQTANRYRELAERLFREGKKGFFIGGDHAVTVPVVQALQVRSPCLHVVQLDAHPDLYGEYDGNRHSHACTAARLLEMEHVASLTQLGIRTMNEPQNRIARRYATRLRLYPARELGTALPRLSHLPPDADVYLTVYSGVQLRPEKPPAHRVTLRVRRSK